MASIVDKLIKRFNNEDVLKFSDKDLFSEQNMWITTGSPSLDLNLNTLGIPAGLSLVAGDSRSGKTTLCLHLMKNFQRKFPDGVCIILSSESRDNKIYAKKIGIDTDQVLIIKSKFLEDLFYKLQFAIDDTKAIWKQEKLKGKPKFFVMWDSVGGTLSRAEVKAFRENVDAMRKSLEKGKDKEAEIEVKMMAFQKEAKRLVKSLVAQMSEIDMCFMAIAHTGDSTNGRGKVVYGGTWNEFFSTIRLQTSIYQHEKLDDVEVAQYTKVKVLKNDFGSRKATNLEILLSYGIILSEEDIAYGVEKGIIKKLSAKKHSFMDDKLAWSSKREFYLLYENGNKFLNILQNKLLAEAHKDVLEMKKTGKVNSFSTKKKEADADEE